MQASDGKLYGITNNGGAAGYGVIFSYVANTSTYTVLTNFGTSTTGSLVLGGLLKTSTGKLYGMTNSGGSNGCGVIFSFDATTATYTKLKDFDNTNGRNPFGSLIQASDGKLYGMTNGGGSAGVGVIFSFDASSSTYTKLKDFDNTNGRGPQGSLIQASDGKLYGMTFSGGNNNSGVIFSFDPVSLTYTKLKDLDYINGGVPNGSLVQASDGKLYGMTQGGGSNGYGVIFSFDATTATYIKLKDLDYTIGGNPYGSLIQASDGKLYGMTRSGGSNGYGVIFSFDPVSLAYTKLKDLDYTNGGYPYGSLIQASDGKLYGMTASGGSTGNGVTFSFDPLTAAYTKLTDFNGANGASPQYTAFTEVCIPTTYYKDADGDGFGDPGNTIAECSSTPPPGYVTDNTDCNDNDASMHQSYPFYLDADDDGYGTGASVMVCAVDANTPPAGYALLSGDNCPDTYNPDQADIDTDGIGDVCDEDDDNDGRFDEEDCAPLDNTKWQSDIVYIDNDGDGYDAGSVTICYGADLPAGYIFSSGGPDCNDNDAAVNSPITYYRDADGDGFGDPGNIIEVCSTTPPPGYITDNSDCDDTRLSYADNDGDGYGAGSPVACGFPDNTDCDDNDPTVNSPITYYRDADNDGFGDAGNTTTVCSATPPAGYVTDNSDCDDTKLLYADNDGDGYGAGSPVACGIESNTDCNDNNAGVNPGATEICGNGIDDDCDGQVDEGCTISKIQVGILNSAKTEGRNQKVMKFKVQLNKKSAQPVQVSYATQDVTAIAGSDYIATSGTITFAPGVKKLTISVTILGDRVAEPDETFRVVLSNPVNASIAAAYNPAFGTILNDDGGTVATSVTQTNNKPATLQTRTVKVSPNPASRVMYVQLTGYTGNVTLQLTTIDGRVIMQNKMQTASAKFAQQKLNLPDIANGVYFLIITDKDGIKHTEKVVIQR